MQLKALLLYHRDGDRRSELSFTPGRLNILTGASDTGKSSVLAIVDYCLGSSSHGVYRGPELDTIGWYGLSLEIKGEQVFVARRRPRPHEQGTDEAMLVFGEGGVPAANEIAANTNISTVTTELGRRLGIAENLQAPPEGSSRAGVAATLRHAVPYVLQPQRLIADPKFLFDGQENAFKEQHIRDTLPYFLGAVDQDALAQRRELQARRAELRRARADLLDASRADDAVTVRAGLLLDEARASGLADPTADPTRDVREALQAALDRPLAETGPLSGDSEEIAELHSRKSEMADAIREARAERRTLVQRARLAVEVAEESSEQSARLRSLNLLPELDSQGGACPLCGSSEHQTPTAADLRGELERVQAQTAAAQLGAPLVQESISRLDVEIQEKLGRLEEFDSALKAVVARSERTRQAQGRLEQQSFVKGRIAGFLQEHPASDPRSHEELAAIVQLAEVRVAALEEALSADTTRRRTENALSYVGADMTQMAAALRLGYAESGVQLDPVALTVVARDPNGPVWLRDDIGSGKNWVGYHVVTLLALHRYFVEHDRPVPRLLILDQPTQAFFPSQRRDDATRSLEELPDDDQAQVSRIFDLLRSTVSSLGGQLQIIVMDHVELDEPWFAEAAGDRLWRGGAGLVPDDWF